MNETIDEKPNFITNSPANLLKFIIIQKKDTVIEAIERYLEFSSHSRTTPTHYIRSRLNSLFLSVYSGLKRGLKKEEFTELDKLKDSDKFDDLYKAFIIIEVWLDNSKITRIDLYKEMDLSLVENENKMYGL
jgi:hypothetical protein